ncbi:hypothetical protein HPP92_026568 [Vanilla planifolia]|uniref:RST domain-containing protein n=1 Tax=Vanilla planifolia TaxID=51239 RepID=A0A835PCH1_VANPL|nr:hypothetical protein HPP92_026568 [Vanilla planifolia]
MATIPFHMLIPILRPHLDKDRSMQLQSIFSKLRSNEVSKDDFLRVIRNIVGDQMLRQAVQKLQIQLQAQASRNPQTSPNLYSLQNQKVQKSPLGQPQLSSSTFTRQTESTFPTAEASRQMSRELDGKATHSGQTRSAGLGVVNQEREIAISPFQAANKQPQHTQMPQSSFPMYGVAPTNFQSHQFSRPSIGAQSTSHKLQGQDSQTRQALHAQGIAATQIGSSQLMSMAHMRKYELQNTITESKRGYGGSFAGHPLSQQNSVTLQTYSNKEQRSTAIPSISNVKPEVMDQASESAGMPKLTFPESSSHGIGNIEQNELQSSKVAFSAPMNTLGSHVPGLVPSNIDGAIQVSSSMPSHVPGTTAKTPQKKSLAGQKKPLEASGTSPPSKKPKISGALHDQSIDHLNDVTAVSGVNLREEEEQLLCAPKGESRASEATRRVVQEEEERLILQRIPLQKKLAEITNDCGIKNIGNDVERCLSLCVEERLRGLITTLVKLSKQRVDGEKSRHRFVVTSDVGQQILTINRKMKEDWDKKTGRGIRKVRKVVEGEGDTGSEAEKEKEKDKEKDDGRPKATKANKEEDDKMRTTAANVAARAAVGGDDMLSKWQLMAEQARQKREGLDGASSSLANKTVGTKSLATLRKHEQQESERRGSLPPLPGVPRKMAKAQAGIIPHTKVSHRISMKDVISALEREPQMSKSTLIYRLYERKTGDSAVE